MNVWMCACPGRVCCPCISGWRVIQPKFSTCGAGLLAIIFRSVPQPHCCMRRYRGDTQRHTGFSYGHFPHALKTATGSRLLLPDVPVACFVRWWSELHLPHLSQHLEQVTERPIQFTQQSSALIMGITSPLHGGSHSAAASVLKRITAAHCSDALLSKICRVVTLRADAETAIRLHARCLTTDSWHAA